MKCPECGSEKTETYRHPFAKVWCSECGYVIKKEDYGCAVYCTCGVELITSNSFISDTYDNNSDNHVLYKCKICGKYTDFNFDVAPLPIPWDELGHNDVSKAHLDELIRVNEILDEILEDDDENN